MTPATYPTYQRVLLKGSLGFGADYDRTLMAWWENFQAGWPHLARFPEGQAEFRAALPVQFPRLSHWRK
jgi:hypothetical protein